MPFAQLNGSQIHYEVGGDPANPDVLLSNSLLSDFFMWDPQWHALTERYHVVRYDNRGHGQTEVTAPPYTMEQLADDAAALIDHTGLNKPHFIGLSLGGMIGQVMGIRHPDKVSSLCLMATTCLKPSQSKKVWNDRITHVTQTRSFDKLLPQILDRWLSMKFRREQPGKFKTIVDMILRTPPMGYVGCCAAIRDYDIRDALHQIKKPTLIMVGEEDSGTSLEDAQMIANGIKESVLEVTPHYRHLINWEDEGRVTTRLLSWLAAASNA